MNDAELAQASAEMRADIDDTDGDDVLNVIIVTFTGSATPRRLVTHHALEDWQDPITEAERLYRIYTMQGATNVVVEPRRYALIPF